MSPEPTEVTDPASLEALRPTWRALWERTHGANPFQHPAWLIPWWRSFGAGQRLLTLAFRDGDRLDGLWPLYVLEEPGGGPRKLLPLGIGITDRLDPLLDPELAAAALAHLARRANGFDRLDLPALAPGSPLLRAPAPSGWRDEAGPCEPCPALALPDRPDALRRAVPRLGRQPYYLSRAARLGRVELAPATADDLPEALDALFRLHALRWPDTGGVLANPQVQAFHRAAAPELLAEGLLRCHVLRVDGGTVAVLHALADRSACHAYILGYDPTLPHPGLGALMIGHAIEAAAAEGLAEFDFLRGREPYKYAWGATDRPAFRRSLRPA